MFLSIEVTNCLCRIFEKSVTIIIALKRFFFSISHLLHVVFFAETKFVSSCNLTAEWEKWEGVSAEAIAEILKKRQSRGSKTYGAFDSLQSSQLRLACKSYCVGYRSPSMAGAQWFQNMFSSIKKTRAVVVVARPRVYLLCLPCMANKPDIQNLYLCTAEFFLCSFECPLPLAPALHLLSIFRT